MRLAVPLALALLLSGCGAKTVAPLPDVYLEDATGDAEPRYDIVRANFTELNGSLALRVQIEDYTEGLPLVEARIETSVGDYFARIVLDPSRPQPPKVRAEQGRWIDGERAEAATTCWFPSFPTNPSSDAPWWIFLEFLHNRTGLDGGGTVHALWVTTTDQDGAVQDEAEHEADFRVAGGPNPYGEECPMSKERSRLV